MKSIILLFLFFINFSYGQMDQWIIQNRSINPENGFNVSIPAGPLDPTDYAENAIYFPNGDLALFVKDGNIYNAIGVFITSLLYDQNSNCSIPPNNTLNSEIGMGYSETLIVKVPGSSCNEYYIISSFGRKKICWRSEERRVGKECCR